MTWSIFQGPVDLTVSDLVSTERAERQQVLPPVDSLETSEKLTHIELFNWKDEGATARYLKEKVPLMSCFLSLYLGKLVVVQLILLHLAQPFPERTFPS